MGYPRALRTELHKALSDAGIKYWMAQGITAWNCDDGRECLAYGYECSDGTPRIAVKVVGIRDPQQAIEMTAGMTDERIVRCRDCKHYHPEEEYEEEVECGYTETFIEPGACFNPERCYMTYDCSIGKRVPVGVYTEPDGFCKWGEPRSGV